MLPLVRSIMIHNNQNEDFIEAGKINTEQTISDSTSDSQELGADLLTYEP